MKLGLFALALVACHEAPKPRVYDCAVSYAICAETSSDHASYEACRAKVDALCLAAAADAGGTR